MNRKSIFLLLCGLCISLFANAQEVWSLEKCINQAMDKNLNLELTRLGTQNAELSLQGAKESRFPSLSGSIGLNGNFGRSIDPVSNAFESRNFYSNGYSLGGGILLYGGGVINKSIQQSKIDLEATQYDEQTSRNNIALTVVNSFLQVLLAEENLGNARERYTVVQEQVANTRKLVEAGALARVDLLTIEAQGARELQSITTAENNYDLNLLALKQVLWLEPDFELGIVAPEGLEAEEYLVERSFDEVYVSALRQLPEVKANELRVQSAKLAEEIAKTNRMPRVTLGYGAGTNWSSVVQEPTITGVQRVGQEVFINDLPVLIETEQPTFTLQNTPYTDQLNNNINYNLNIGASIPIYANGQNRIGQQRAELNTLSQSIADEQGKQTIKTNVQTAIANHKAAVQQYLAASRSLESLRLAADNAQRQYDLGVINSYDLINARNNYQQVETEVLLAKYDLIFRQKLIDFFMGIPLTL